MVELISSPQVRLAACIEGDDRPVAFQGGENPPFGPARGTIDFVPRDVYADARQPKRLVTYGQGGEFPAGITIGEVVKVAPNSDGLFQSGVVQLDPALAALSEVTVLIAAAPAPAAP